MALSGLLLATLLPLVTATYIDSVAANVDETRRHEKFVPLVAFECGFRNKYIDENGVWKTDSNRYATCQSGKLDILKYCQKAYPKMNITNIVEYSHEVEIDSWCREEGTPCRWTHVVRPYQCIDGEFRSEALQVPHDCRFSHVNSRDSCNDYQHWRDEAKKICKSKRFNDKEMTVRSFAVLEPCGLDLFTGVEFVCCPAAEVKPVVFEKAEKTESKIDKAAKKLPTESEDEDDDYDEDYTESDEDDTEEVGQDPYFTKIDKENEHEAFRDALERLENKHRAKVDKVMKEWSSLEARYNEMKTKDPKGADKFKVSMTNRFQKTVASLEEEHKESRRALEKEHEDRVQASLSERKRLATHEYRRALSDHVKSPNKKQVLKTLKTYIRAEEKDRMHTLNKYRHLLRTDQAEAALYRDTVLHKLRYIDLRINGTLAMLRDFPDLDKNVRSIAVEYWADFRRENTPDLSDEALSSLNTLDSEAKNKKLVDLYKESYEKLHPSMKLDVRAPEPTTTTVKPTTPDSLEDDSESSEEKDDDYYEDEDDEEVRKPVTKQPIKVMDIEEKTFQEPKKIVESEEKSTQTNFDEDIDSDSDEDDDSFDDDDQTKELKVNIEPIIEEMPSFYKHEKLVQHQNSMDVGIGASSQLLFMFVAVFMVAACLMVVSFMRRRRLHQGFIEVDVYTPEERHVAGMQVNGYENPTYSFFDSKA